MFKEYIDPHNNFNNIKWFHTLSETKPCNKGEITEDSFSINIIDRIDKSGTTMNCVLPLAYHMCFYEKLSLKYFFGKSKLFKICLTNKFNYNLNHCRIILLDKFFLQKK